ncbi:MAG: type II secretion system protein, partial [Planctomycetota bacterium]
MKRAFTLIELLVVTAIIALLLGILLPVISRARLQAKVVTVNAELREIGMALEAYSFDNSDKYPPTRVDCMLGNHFYQLPCELVESNYLPAPGEDTFMSTGIEDRFNRGYTYKYRTVGTLIYNRTVVV